MLYPGGRFRMADELLDAYLRQLIEAHARVPEVTIAWQRGEPTLMGLDFFRQSVELAQRYLQPGQRAACTIQTNGTLIDEAWAAFFAEHGFLVGLSIDGPGAAPSEIVALYAAEEGRRGRNDPCTCGSAVRGSIVTAPSERLARQEEPWDRESARCSRSRSAWRSAPFRSSP
jgi:hypothetical protein